MKIIASDFDGTLLLPGKETLLSTDLEAIERWRAAGNLFGIATGRGINLIEKSLQRFGLSTDFLICANGAVISRNGRVCQTHRLTRSVFTSLISSPIVRGSSYVLCFTVRRAFLCVLSRNFRPPIDDFPVKMMSFAELLHLPDVVQVSLRFDYDPAADVPPEIRRYGSREKAEQAAKMLTHAFRGKLEIYGNRGFLDLVPSGITKGSGLRELLSLEGLTEEDLVTIGDDDNDLPMLEPFTSYTVPHGSLRAKQAAQEVIPSVGSLIDHLLQKKQTETAAKKD